MADPFMGNWVYSGTVSFYRISACQSANPPAVTSEARNSTLLRSSCKWASYCNELLGNGRGRNTQKFKRPTTQWGTALMPWPPCCLTHSHSFIMWSLLPGGLPLIVLLSCHAYLLRRQCSGITSGIYLEKIKSCMESWNNTNVNVRQD